MRYGKRTVSLLLVIIMLLGILPAPAVAAEETPAYTVNNRAGSQIYSTANRSDFLTAWGHAQANGGTLNLYADAEATGKLVVKSQKPLTIVMNGHSIRRSLSNAADSGEVILVEPNTTLTIVNTTDGTAEAAGKITGGWSSSGGGGIHVQENSTLRLRGVTVTGNKSTAGGGGGGIRLQGKNTTLDMDAYSSVSGNSAKKGGGISIMGEDSRIIGARLEENSAAVSDNKATESNGGGIYVGAKDCFISGLNIRNNEATVSDSHGGGIYMAENCGCEVTDCTITENSAHHGGGIYVDGNGGSLSYSIITKNSAQGKTGCGGGIYIDNGDTLHLSGKLSVYGNTAADMERANLYLDTNRYMEPLEGLKVYFCAYISGEPSGPMVDGEFVHIGWDKNVREEQYAEGIVICSEKGQYSADYLRSDVEGYSIYWSWGTEDGINDRRIRAGSKIPQSELPKTEYVSVNDRYKIIPDGYTQDGETFDLQQGVYSFRAFSGNDLDSTYFYSDGYFAEDPKNYNDHLATMSLVLAVSAFNASDTDFDIEKTFNGGYSNRFRYARQLLADLGFRDENIHVSDTFLKKPTNFSIGVIMGAKEMSLTKEVAGEEKPYILLPISVRGAGYETEWVSNVTLGASGEAAGFSGAADQVMENLELFLSTHPDLQEALNEGRVKFWLTGFSRSAATANLTSKRLTDQYGEHNRIYAYCFEPPKGGVDSEVLNAAHTYNGQYLNIHNIVNACDIVPYVGPAEMGFKRYGVDHFVPGKSFSEERLEKKKHQATTNKGSGTIQVTTYADNAFLPMEQDSSTDDGKLYTKRRAGMIEQLKLLDDTVVYDDYFRLATVNYIGDELGTCTMIGELKNGDQTYAHEWIPVFFKNLQEWALNNTWDNDKETNKFNDDYRGFYSTNTSFTGKKYVTVEEALQVAVSLVFCMSAETTSQLTDAIMYRLLQMDLTSLYWNIIIYWYENSYDEQQGLVNKIWNQMEKDMTRDGQPVPKLSEILSETEYNELKRVFHTLISFLCQFVNYDWWEEPSPSLDGVDTTQIHVGTLAYNAFGLLLHHNPEVVMAWMRTYDSHYMVEERTGFVSADESDPLINSKIVLVAEEEDRPVGSQMEVPVAAVPRIRFEGTSEDNIFLESATVTISTDIRDGDITNGANGENNGSAIYYRVLSSLSSGPWKLYEGPFEINAVSNDEIVSDQYTVEAYSVRFKDISATTVEHCTIKVMEDIRFKVHNNISSGTEQTKLAAAGQIVNITAGEDRMVRNWEFPEDWTKVDTLDALLLAGDYVLSNDKGSVSFVAPEQDADIRINYYDGCSYIDLCSITPVANQPLAATVDPEMYGSYVDHVPSGPISSNGRLLADIEWSVANQGGTPTVAEAGVSYTATVTFRQEPSQDHAIYIAFGDDLIAKYGDSAYGIVTRHSDTAETVTITCSFPPVAPPALKGIQWPESVSREAADSDITGAPNTVVFDIGGMKIDVPVIWSEKENDTAVGTVSIVSTEEVSTVTAANGVAYSFTANLEHFKGNALDGYTDSTVYKHVPLTVDSSQELLLMAQPVVNLSPGTYNETKLVTVSHPLEGAALTVTYNNPENGADQVLLASGDPMDGASQTFSRSGAAAGENQILLAAGEPGTSTAYSITVTAQKNGQTSSATFGYTIAAPDVSHQVTVNCHDINLDEPVTTWTGMPVDFRTTYTEGEEVTVPAPVFANMQFVEWVVEGAELTGNASDTVAVFIMGSGNVTLTAKYKPIIRKIDLTIPDLETGKALPASPGTAKATILLEYLMDPNSLVLNWIPDADKIEPDMSYTAEITVSSLKLANGIALSLDNVIIDSSTKLTVNGERASILKQGDDYKGIWTFTNKSVSTPVITDIEVPGNVYLDRSEMSSVPVRLPGSVNVTVEPANSGVEAVNLIWQLAGAYDPNRPEAQYVVAEGTLVIPDNVVLAAGLAGNIDTDPATEGIQIRLVFYADEADRAGMPAAMPGTGSYETSPFIQLTTDTAGADIYYTLDGTTPTQNSTKYTGGFEVDLGMTLNAIAVKNGLFDSHVASYTYTKDASGDSNGITVTGVAESYVYTAQPIQPKITVAVNGTVLTEEDYTVSYGNNTTVAEGGSVTVTLNGSYSGSTTLSFGISKAQATVTAHNAKAYIGDPMPALTYTTEGLIGDDTIIVELTCDANLNRMGDTPIVVTAADPNGNYEITTINGTLTVQSKSSIPSNPAYPPLVEDSGNGDVSVTPQNPEQGDTVVITPHPDAGYEVDEILVTDKNGDPVAVIDHGNGTYSFKQPVGKVNIAVTFKAIAAACPGGKTCPMYGFTDLVLNEWYHDGVHYCIEHGLMQGIGSKQFNPGGTTTRAMIVTILWRLDGSPAARARRDFDDVDADQWYAEAIHWAASEKIVEGYGDGTFGTNDAITREQMVTIMFRYAKHKGCDVSDGENINILSYDDALAVAEWAIPAMQWACGNGMIQGIADGSTMNLAPQGSATRAQAAAILQRFCENAAKD